MMSFIKVIMCPVQCLVFYAEKVWGIPKVTTEHWKMPVEKPAGQGVMMHT